MSRSRHRVITVGRLVSAVLALTLAASACKTTDPTSNTVDTAGALRSPAQPDRPASRAPTPPQDRDDHLVDLDPNDSEMGPRAAFDLQDVGQASEARADGDRSADTSALELDDSDAGPSANTKEPHPSHPKEAPEPTAPDEPPPSEPAVLEQCRERYVIAPGVKDQVRARVPEQFTLRYNANGQPLLYVTAIHCERYTAHGVTRSTTAAAFGVSIESPDGTMCATPWPVVGIVKPDLAGSCNNYLVFAAYDNPNVVAWARAGTPDAPVHFIDDLDFDEASLDPASLGVPLHFDSGSTPSSYTLDLVVRERPATVPLAAAFWFESRIGIVRVGFDTDAIALGEASGQLTVEPGSEMARMLGTDTPAAQQPFPLLAGNRWNHATLTKTVIRGDT